MSRQERENMVNFIQKMKDLDTNRLSIMTDDEIEHIYNTVYYHHEEIVE